MAKQLRSGSMWSSETLVSGMKAVTGQPNGLLLKEEDPDEDLQVEYQVSC